jgi:hypothetical protein
MSNTIHLVGRAKFTLEDGTTITIQDNGRLQFCLDRGHDLQRQ